MPDKEFETRKTTPAPRIIPQSSRSPSMEQLHTMSTDDLVKLLVSPELLKPVNAAIRQQIILILIERKGAYFVQRLMGDSTAARK